MFDNINNYISKCVQVHKEELEYFDDVLEYKKNTKKTTGISASPIR